MESHFKTDRGKVREVNEDAAGIFYNEATQILAIVADGMGGHQAGEVASELAIAIAKEQWENQDTLLTPAETEEWVNHLIDKMNRDIYDYALQKEEYEGMGTTAVITISSDEFVTIAHVGDSRCYLFSDNHLKQVTNDHSLVNELVRTGQISETDAEQHPRKNVLIRAIGTEQSTKVDSKTIHWKQHDRLLLCSDGLSNKVSDDELAELLQKMNSIEQLTDELVTLANARGGEDNITVAVIQNTSNTEVGETS